MVLVPVAIKDGVPSSFKIGSPSASNSGDRKFERKIPPLTSPPIVRADPDCLRSSSVRSSRPKSKSGPAKGIRVTDLKPFELMLPELTNPP